MASQDLRAFLSSIAGKYVGYADAIHNGGFTEQAELAAADRSDLVHLDVPTGAAGLIVAAARGNGDSSPSNTSYMHYAPMLNSLLVLTTTVVMQAQKTQRQQRT